MHQTDFFQVENARMHIRTFIKNMRANALKYNVSEIAFISLHINIVI